MHAYKNWAGCGLEWLSSLLGRWPSLTTHMRIMGWNTMNYNMATDQIAGFWGSIIIISCLPLTIHWSLHLLFWSLNHCQDPEPSPWRGESILELVEKLRSKKRWSAHNGYDKSEVQRVRDMQLHRCRSLVRQKMHINAPKSIWYC